VRACVHACVRVFVCLCACVNICTCVGVSVLCTHIHTSICLFDYEPGNIHVHDITCVMLSLSVTEREMEEAAGDQVLCAGGTRGAC